MEGVLIYTASGDSEGSLGGLVREGEPKNLTFVAESFTEPKLYALGAAYENLTLHRQLPKGYE